MDNKVKEGGSRKGEEEEEGKKGGTFSARCLSPPPKPGARREREENYQSLPFALFSLRNLSIGGGGVGLSREKGRKKGR